MLSREMYMFLINIHIIFWSPNPATFAIELFFNYDVKAIQTDEKWIVVEITVISGKLQIAL